MSNPVRAQWPHVDPRGVRSANWEGLAVRLGRAPHLRRLDNGLGTARQGAGGAREGTSLRESGASPRPRRWSPAFKKAWSRAFAAWPPGRGARAALSRQNLGGGADRCGLNSLRLTPLTLPSVHARAESAHPLPCVRDRKGWQDRPRGGFHRADPAPSGGWPTSLVAQAHRRGCIIGCQPTKALRPPGRPTSAAPFARDGGRCAVGSSLPTRAVHRKAGRDEEGRRKRGSWAAAARTGEEGRGLSRPGKHSGLAAPVGRKTRCAPRQYHERSLEFRCCTAIAAREGVEQVRPGAEAAAQSTTHTKPRTHCQDGSYPPPQTP
eukprot:scaffold4851_cov428-Prasinococcus_capsulatus_cf.AAC.13